MYKLSELASNDIDSIIDYTIDKFGIDTMLKYHSSLEKCIQIIGNNTEIGLKSDYIIKDYYRFNHRSHVIYYQKIKTSILIIRVLHKSMDVNRHL
jgi:toxin ParE1/3/4